MTKDDRVYLKPNPPQEIKHDLYVTMALMKTRYHNFEEVIRNIEASIYIPKEIHVFYSKEPYFLDVGFGDEKPTSRYQNVIFHEVPNIGGLRKMNHIMKMKRDEPDAKIIIIDDDMRVHKRTIRDLYNLSEIEQNAMIGTMGYNLLTKTFRIYKNDYQKIYTIYKKSIQPILSRNILLPQQVDCLWSGWCSLTKPRFHSDEIKKDGESDELLIMSDAAQRGIKRIVYAADYKMTETFGQHGKELFRTPENLSKKLEHIRKYFDLLKSV